MHGVPRQSPLILAFHTVTAASALLFMVFAAGLSNRLGVCLLGGSLVPNIALGGLLLVSATRTDRVGYRH